MRKLSQSLGRLAVILLLGAGTPILASSATAARPGKLSSPFFGRWTVAEERPVFTARGKAYKTIDIRACGRDFCGVSVDDRGVCGAILFRFLAEHADGTQMLRGHGKWGEARKNIQIYWSEDSLDDARNLLELYLGDGYDFGGRSDNMPKFHANYRRRGAARCAAR